MDENVQNNEINNGKKLGGITGKGFMPGVSGNPGGRPKGTLKDHIKQKFLLMTADEKEQWLVDNKITGIDQWKMGEGLPKADVELSGELTSKIISVDE
jgi:hypothetical protein